MRTFPDFFKINYFVILVSWLVLKTGYSELMFLNEPLRSHEVIVRNYFDKRKHWQTSNLGSILFKNHDVNNFVPKNRTFKVLLWRYWGYNLFHSSDNADYFTEALSDCSVKNCIFSGGVNSTSFDAVVVNLTTTELLVPPTRTGVNSHQVWVWMSEESPVRTEAYNRIFNIAYYFNWSMTYRTDSEIPIPYGRIAPLPRQYTDDLTNIDLLSLLVPHWTSKRRDVIAAIMTSECDPHRMTFIKELQKHMEVHVYGKCSDDCTIKNICITPELHDEMDCEPLNHYIFHIALENHRCRQYITHQVFNAYSKGAIPIIRGAPVNDLESLLPPSSFITIDSFKGVKELARYLKRISRSEETIMYYHRWRNNFKVINEYGFEEHAMKRKVPLCRICEALNYNDYDGKLYDEDDMRLFLEPRILCQDVPY